MSKKNGKEAPKVPGNGKVDDAVTTLSGMYKDYFLDYASYVILERAVPSIEDGLKTGTTSYPPRHESDGRWPLP